MFISAKENSFPMFCHTWKDIFGCEGHDINDPSTSLFFTSCTPRYLSYMWSQALIMYIWNE